MTLRRDRKIWLSRVGVLLAMALFSLLRFPHTFENWDHPELERIFVATRPARIYLDGVRPYFIQRAAPNSIIFYDLNTRIPSANNLQKLCPIMRCFEPDYFVISGHQKINNSLNNFIPYFDGLVYSSEHVLVATHFNGSCPSKSEFNCMALTMKK